MVLLDDALTTGIWKPTKRDAAAGSEEAYSRTADRLNWWYGSTPEASFSSFDLLQREL